MPHEIMNTMHETGMPAAYHWLFWVIVSAVFLLAFFLVWKYVISRDKRSR